MSSDVERILIEKSKCSSQQPRGHISSYGLNGHSEYHISFTQSKSDIEDDILREILSACEEGSWKIEILHSGIYWEIWTLVPRAIPLFYLRSSVSGSS